MISVKRINDRLNTKLWILPVAFVFSALMAASLILICKLNGFTGMELSNSFTVGADIVAILIGLVLLYSCISDRSGIGEGTRTFVLLITMNSAALFSDACSWIVQGNADLRVCNIAINVMNYSSSAALIYFFWKYTVSALNLHGRLMDIFNLVLNILFVPTIIACFVNIFYPLYFSVDENGVYKRSEIFMWSQTFLAVALIMVIIGFFISKVSIKEKMITASFVFFPIGNMLLTRYAFGISTQYAAMMISITLIYGLQFAEKQKKLMTTEKELSLAAKIQSDLLPNIFPAYPERDEFDLYASMTPAKEVGGDFYDFFLIDDDHLGMIMADVSGKGIPASLFMMASKILLENIALTGEEPAEVLRKANEQICKENNADMFVTVWYGVLEISTGKVKAANAGHEYPAIKKAGGKFELYKDKHGFVIGGMEGIRFRQYEFKMEKGSSLFLYTDGVPEATNSENELFGTDRMLEALNIEADASPEKILSNVHREVDKYVGDAVQFDDLTMFCIRLGKEDKDDN